MTQSKIDLILVPQGAEYLAVSKALKASKKPQLPELLAIPIGAPSKYLESIPNLHNFQNVLIMGLGGSLSQEYAVGDVVIYQDCIKLGNSKSLVCDFELTKIIQQKLPNAPLVNSLTSDRLIHLATEKQKLHQISQAQVVDMEGYSILTNLKQAVAMVRIISDDANHDLPDLTKAIDQDGILQNLPLAIALIRQPIAAIRLITGALKALKVLERTARALI
jgi:nucleoside phosphorylase